jgi:hypothetical protein
MLTGGCCSKEAAPPASGQYLTYSEIYNLVANNTLLFWEGDVKARIEMYGNGKLYAEKSKNNINDGK